MKKITIGIIIVILGIGSYLLVSNIKKPKKEMNYEENNLKSSQTLVIYYSATGSTEKVAEQIVKNINADLWEIIPEQEYTKEDLDWTNQNSRVSKEHDDESLRQVKLRTTKVENWDNYDTIFIGYPIWWGIAAWPVDTFVKNNNFEGKTVIPFCTSASSELGQSGKQLEKTAKTGNWLEGKRFQSNVSNNEIKNWIDNLK